MSAVAWVAGATGFVGRALVPALVARGVRTLAHVRPDSSALASWQARFGAVGAEVNAAPWSHEALRDALAAAAVTHLFCVIGTTKTRARAERVDGDPYQAIDFGLTARLVDAAVASTRPRFIYLSSLGADAHARSAYLRARGQAEEAVRASGLSYRIARPAIITGAARDDARPAERAAAVVGDAALAVASWFGARTLRARYRSVDGSTLAGALAQLGFDDGPDRVVTNDAFVPSANHR